MKNISKISSVESVPRSFEPQAQRYNQAFNRPKNLLARLTGTLQGTVASAATRAEQRGVPTLVGKTSDILSNALGYAALILLFPYSTRANPEGGVVAPGYLATISTLGSVSTINQSSQNAFINWRSFDIGRGETTIFNQPSSSSVTWNQINDVNASQILGNLNANGFIVLQNQNGFYVGGSASISTHGLIMTTAHCPAPDLSSGGPWSFNIPPPTANIQNVAQIKNDGQINVAGGNSAFLIASDIVNNGTISAPGGKIGLYAGQTVLVSTSPDGRGLSARVTLPQGSVDNEGKLIADAGSIVAQAKTVNQNGLVQANSVQSVNGVIELLASDSLNLGANSVISAKGDSTGISSGGTVTLKSDNAYSDQLGSVIDISGGAQGGNGGMLEISAPQMDSIQSAINGQASPGYLNGLFTLDPYNILLTSASSDPNAAYGGTVVASDPPIGVGSTLTLDVTKFASTLSQINLQALNNITLGTLWTLGDSLTPAQLSMTAGNNITLNDGTGIQAGRNWNLSLTAGTALPSGSVPSSGNSGIYLNGSSFIQTQNGNINLWAAHEIQVGWSGSANRVGYANNGLGSITTKSGGNINVTAEYGDINTGSGLGGFVYNNGSTAPFYSIDSNLGGISTASGGNVSLMAGNNITSLPATVIAASDAGSGAFGSSPGNMTISAGANVYGHYVVVNGDGVITAGQNVGGAFDGSGAPAIALSLVKGGWTVNAPNGNINLEEVRNPNGVFNNTSVQINRRQSGPSPGNHYFDYDPLSYLDLNAGIGVFLSGTQAGVPRPNAPVPIIYPPSMEITAGSGGVKVSDNVIFFPSASGNLQITTTGGGNLSNDPNGPTQYPTLQMSDSSSSRWVSAATFGTTDHGVGMPLEINNPNPVLLNISGNIQNMQIIATKPTTINVAGNLINSSFSGENLYTTDITSINVVGQIINQPAYSFVYLDQAIQNLPTMYLPIGANSTWQSIFNYAVIPENIPSPASLLGTKPQNILGLLVNRSATFGINPGFVYDSKTLKLGFGGPMSSGLLNKLNSPLYFLVLQNGYPVVDNNASDHSLGRTYGQYEYDQVQGLPVSPLQSLYNASQSTTSPNNPLLGYQVGGPGSFNVSAGSIALGNSYGILSWGVGSTSVGIRFNNLVPVTTQGATINVTSAGDLSMLTSTIATLGGGDVNVNARNGTITLGSQDLLDNSARSPALGIFTAGKGDVNITALKNVDINTSRVATYDGGNINIVSLQGDVNAGSGGTGFVTIPVSYVNVFGLIGYSEVVFGSGILANTYVDPTQVTGSAIQPGNIAVTTPRGSIIASSGGILQEALNGNVSSGPSITLLAGTFPSGNSAGYSGNIDLQPSGVIGGTIIAKANGNINGLVISRQNSSVQAAQNFVGTVLAGGSANVSGGGSVSGTIIGVGGASVSGGSVTAEVLSQNASVNGGSSQSTLGSASASAASQSASNQSNNDNKKQFASNDTSEDDDKKKKGKPVLQRIKRVTVLLPKAS